jgi:MerR family transcriptional regulator, light-induced transcriptional regulator
METYTIKQLETLSGIKAHTIRIWEQRYSMLTPNRTDTNIRLYDCSQLKKLLNINLLYKNGVKISKIAKLSDDEICEAVSTIHINENECFDTQSKIKELVISALTLDEELFNKVFSSIHLKIGTEKTITELIYPFLSHIGMMWGINKLNPAQEHFVSNLIRQKLITAIDGITCKPKDDDIYVLFLPENEYHEIGLLVSQYFLKLNGKKVIYLGQNVPFGDLKDIFTISKAKNGLCFFVADYSVEKINTYLNQFSKQYPDVTLNIAGNNEKMSLCSLPPTIYPLYSLQDLLLKI